MTLYEQNPAAWDRIAASGKPALVAMAKLFDTVESMDRALGATKAAYHWHTGRNTASMTYDRRARLWLDAQAPAPASTPKATETVYMVICPAAKSETVARVLRALACEVVEM
jgi:hypothetical protein